ncbi:MAG: PEP-CTERM sorting domain-containing protein [Verrucomicrobia bacterium]|nr:PEP-CTERM sorting domain-containing protein [Verrucomicrobiota bacterium]
MQGVLGFTANSLDPTDFYLTWNFGVLRAVSIGNTVTVGAGTTTVPGWLDPLGINGTVPDLPATTAQFINTNGNALSNPIAVPEPSAALLALAGLLGLAGLRRSRPS